MADQDNKEESQKWLTYFETCIVEQQDLRDLDNEAPYYEAVRDMLLHKGDSDEAISQAIERCYGHDIHSIDTENARFEEDGEKGPHKELPYPDPKNEFLAQFLIRMAKNIPPEYGEEGAATARALDGIQMAVHDPWNALSMDGIRLDRERPDVEEIAHASLNTMTLIAKLFQSDLLGTCGARWVSHDLKSAFESQTEGDITKHILKQAQILVVANYMIIAGDAFAKVVSIKKWADNYEITAKKWKDWTSKLQEMADAVDRDTRWDLKERLQNAHDKMVEIQQVL